MFYLYVRETGGLTNSLDNMCFATQNLVGDLPEWKFVVTQRVDELVLKRWIVYCIYTGFFTPVLYWS